MIPASSRAEPNSNFFDESRARFWQESQAEVSLSLDRSPAWSYEQAQSLRLIEDKSGRRDSNSRHPAWEARQQLAKPC